MSHLDSDVLCSGLASPIGTLHLLERPDGSVLRVDFAAGATPPPGTRVWDGRNSALRRQLQEYFAGARRQFDLVLCPAGTPFQQAVWRALQAIPYGATCSYGDIARAIGRPKAVRAVGAANGRNPIPIVVPCHRVIGGDGSLTGYGGGLPRKRALLELERQVTARSSPAPTAAPAAR